MILYPLSEISISDDKIRVFPKNGHLFDARWGQERGAWIDLCTHEVVPIEQIEGAYINLSDFEISRNLVATDKD